MKRLVLAFLIVVAPRSAVAQGAPAPTDCTYLTCALRVSDDAIVAGVAEREVGSFGMFSPPDLRELLAASDSASDYFSIVEDNYRSGKVLGWVGAIVMVGSVFAIDWRHDDDEDWTSDDFVILGVGLGGVGLALWGEDRVKHARDAMNQAMWWYNGSLDPR